MSLSSPSPRPAERSSAPKRKRARLLPSRPISSPVHAPSARDLNVLAGRGSKGFAHLKILLSGIEAQVERDEGLWDRFAEDIEVRLEELDEVFRNVELRRSHGEGGASEASDHEAVEDTIRQLSQVFKPPNTSALLEFPVEFGEISSPMIPGLSSPLMATGRFWNRPAQDVERAAPAPKIPRPMNTLPTPPDSSQASGHAASSGSSAGISQRTQSQSSSSDLVLSRRLSSGTPSPRELHPASPRDRDRRSLSSGIESLPATIHAYTRSPSMILPFTRKRPRRVLSSRSPSQTRSERAVSEELGLESETRQRDSETPLPANSPSPTPSESTVDSNVRGSSLHSEQSTLDESQGSRIEPKGLWPPLGANTVRGRMSEVTCDSCGGRVHWACAGFSRPESLSREPWCCPLCENLLDTEETPEIQNNPPKDRCIRPNCILRFHSLPILRRPNEDDEYHFARIIGRKVVRRTVNGVRVFEYLVKWQDPWPLYDSTWEPKKNIPDLPHHEREFLDKCKKHDLDITCKIILLPEASEYWDESGNHMREKLDAMGVEPRRWWESEMAKRSSRKRRY